MAQGKHAGSAIRGALALILPLAAIMPARAVAEDTALKVPRFVSLRSDKVNLRTGPGRQYPIEWVLVRKDMPVEIVAQFEHWRRIREWDGTEGWVQEHMVDGKRFVVIAGGVPARSLRRQPDPSSPVVARAEPGVVARLAECHGEWCRVEAGDISGWLPRTDIWGVLPDETGP